jgi:hypothetical protein
VDRLCRPGRPIRLTAKRGIYPSDQVSG